LQIVQPGGGATPLRSEEAPLHIGHSLERSPYSQSKKGSSIANAGHAAAARWPHWVREGLKWI